MKVLDPDDTTHSVSFIPRFTPSGAITLEISKEGYQNIETVANSYSITNGIVTIQFDYTVIEGERYAMKLTNASSVVYRGKIMVTGQSSQEYSTSLDYFVYE